jgi:hypothetical protein
MGRGSDGLPRAPKKRMMPKIIPPCSLFRLERSDSKTSAWKKDVGRVFRIGYYSQQDGLDVIWLVNENGETSRRQTGSSCLRTLNQLKSVMRLICTAQESRNLNP